MTLVHVSGPANLPVSVAEVKMHTVVEDDADDFIIETYIRSALEQIELSTGRVFMSQTWRWTGDAFPDDEISLDMGPIASVTSVTYVDENGDTQTLDPAEYTVDAISPVGRVILAGSAWPSTSEVANAVKVEFVAGTDVVPEPVRHAIMLMAADAFQNREDGGGMKAAPSSLVSPYRRICFG